MKRVIKILTGAMFALSMILMSCGGSNGSAGTSSSGAEVEPGKLILPETPTDPAYVAAASVANQLDPENKKYILFFYGTGMSDYSDKTAYLWVGNGTTCSTAMTTKSINGIKIGYLEFYDGSTALPGIPADVISTLDAGGSIKAIVKNTGSSWTWQTNDCALTTATGDRHFLITSGSASKSENKTYSVSDTVTPMILGASSTSAKEIKVSLNVGLGLETTAGSSGFKLKDSDGTEYKISDALNFDNQNDRNKNKASNVLLKTAEALVTNKTYLVSHPLLKPAVGIEVAMTGAVKDSPVYDGDDLGLTLDGNKATFKSWAPSASSVSLLVYSSVSDVGNFNDAAVKSNSVGSLDNVELLGTPAETFDMSFDAKTGVWSYVIEDVTPYKYYKFKIVNSGVTTYVSDIWGKSCSPDAIASQIVDINKAAEAMPVSTTDTAYGTKSAYYNPFKGDGTKAVVYEMHITDWSYAVPETEDLTINVGKYLDVANDKVVNHIKDLGVTHIQLLPVFEFAETNANTKYNWGYNPYHYNVPEGRYVTVGYEDGTQAVCELRSLISKFHENGIAVIMDVVYNHTNGTVGGSLYDSTVPYYFYRMTEAGTYSNGSGCGNEIDSEAKMAKKYIIDSLKHWMLDYHFNGFRFDLMGCLSKETMGDIYDALHEIDENVMVYGEPWTGGTAAVVNGADSAVSCSVGTGAGAFDDDFRDSVKGPEFGGFSEGQVQGVNKDKGIVAGLCGKSGSNNRNTTGKLALRMNYVECHDNYTLFDKLAISKWRAEKSKDTVTTGDLASKISPEGLADVIAQDKLAASYVMLAQGTAFINGGQEFLRTKRGDENSYATSNKSSYTTNGIRLERKAEYEDVYNVYKGLIALRKANSDAFGANTSAKAETVKAGVTKYTTGNFCVYFNATDSSVNIETTGYSKLVDITSGSVVKNSTLPTSVSAKSFVILEK